MVQKRCCKNFIHTEEKKRKKLRFYFEKQKAGEKKTSTAFPSSSRQTPREEWHWPR